MSEHDTLNHHDQVTTKLVQIRDEVERIKNSPDPISDQDVEWIHSKFAGLIDSFLDVRLDMVKLIYNR